MTPLTDAERDELNALLSAGTVLPEKWLHRLFPNGRKAESVGKEYRLVYDGKLTREEVLAQTPAAPWQLVRSFCAERPHPDGWRNLLVWGDNAHDWQKTYAIHQQNRKTYGGQVKPISIVVTQEIARCVEVWRELVQFLAKKEKITTAWFE